MVCGIVTQPRGMAMNNCAQARLCPWAELWKGERKTLHWIQEFFHKTVHYSFSTVWRVSPYGFVGWIGWAASHLNDSLLFPLLTAIFLIGFFRLQFDSKRISNGQVRPGFPPPPLCSHLIVPLCPWLIFPSSNMQLSDSVKRVWELYLVLLLCCQCHI